MDGGDAPSGIKTLANRGIDEQEIVVEMRNDGDERARFAVRRARCRWKHGQCKQRKQCEERKACSPNKTGRR
jgi:hypothetical protein